MNLQLIRSDNLKILSSFITYVLLILFLYGCSTSTIVTRQASLPEGKGVILLELVSNSTNENDAFSTISIWSDTEKKVYYAKSEEALSPDNTEMKSTAYFVATLPSGKYWIDSGISHHYLNMNMTRTVTIPMHDQLGSFDVVAGEVTDLGVIAFVPNPSDDNPEGFQLVKIDRQHQFSKTFAHKYPKLFSQAKDKSIHGWNELPSTVTNKFIQSHVKSNLYHVNQFYESSNGEIFAGGRFGQILHRNSAGKWANINTGSSREILDIAISSDNTIYALGESTILTSRDNGGNWREISIPDVVGPYMDLTISPEDEVFLLVRTSVGFATSDYKMLQYQAANDQWIEMYAFTAMLGSTRFKVPMEVSSGFFPELRYAINGEHFSLSDGEMVSHKADAHGRRPKYLFDGTLYSISDMHIEIVENDGGTAVGQLVNDVGVSFYDYKSKKKRYIGDWPRLKGYYAIDSAFLNQDEGWILLAKRHSLIGEFDKSRLFFTRDGGKSWKKVHELITPKGKLFVSSSGELFLFGGDSFGGIYSSADFGENWTKERETYTLQELLDLMKRN